jgi:DNA-binding response OmpR family regulator
VDALRHSFADLAARWRWAMTGGYIAVLYASLPFTKQVVLSLKELHVFPALVTGIYLAVAAIVLWLMLFLYRIRDLAAYVLMSCLAVILAYFVLGLEVPEERVHFIQYGVLSVSMCYSARTRWEGWRLYCRDRGGGRDRRMPAVLHPGAGLRPARHRLQRHGGDRQRVLRDFPHLSRAEGVSPVRILVVEDDPSIQTVVGYALAKAGHEVLAATNLAAARAVVQAGRAEFAVLDVVLPDGDGFTLAREIRARGALPILFLTSRSEEVDRVLGFSVGADDYVTKPFSLAELVMRIEAIHRRAGSVQAPLVQQRQGKVVVDDKAREVLVDGVALGLTVTEFDLLQLLQQHQRQVCTREFLLDRLSRDNLDKGDRSIDAHVKRLRRKLEGRGVDPIKTVRGVGYRYELD